MSNYNLKFHEALKIAVEDGCDIETVIHNYRFTVIDGKLMRKNPEDNSETHPTEDINWFINIHSKWRVIEKPKRIEFECRWDNHINTGPRPYAYSENLNQFIGKRTLVIIEEIQK